MRFAVRHQTSYRYETTVSSSYSEARLLPRIGPDQALVESRVQVDPAPEDRRDRADLYGNRVLYFALTEPHDQLTVTATSLVETFPQQPLRSDLSWEDAVAALAATDDPELRLARQFVLDSPLAATHPSLAAYAAGSFSPGRSLVEAATELASRIHDEFTYRPGSTTISTHVTEVLTRREGVCQDFTHLLIACVRSLGLAARYVSGYLETEPAPGQPKLVGSDASHAWAAILVPGAGWLELDPTNDQVRNDRYVTLAWGRDYGDVTPLKGIVYNEGGGQHLDVAVDVHRI